MAGGAERSESPRESPRSWTALVVDDTAEARALLREKLSACGFRVAQARDAFHALERLPEVAPDLVVTDLRMPGQDGIDLVRRIREFSDVPIIVITAYPSVPTCESALRGGAQRFLRWRQDLDQLGEVASDLLRERERGRAAGAPVHDVTAARSRRRRELRDHLERLLVECQGNISRMADRLGRDRATVVYHLRKFGLFERRERDH
jgi:two-component system response regulator RegA